MISIIGTVIVDFIIVINTVHQNYVLSETSPWATVIYQLSIITGIMTIIIMKNITINISIIIKILKN